jgi:hypothetical protein
MRMIYTQMNEHKMLKNIAQITETETEANVQ